MDDNMNYQEGQLINRLELLKIDRDNSYSLLSQALRLLQDLSREMDHLQSSVENGVLRTSELEAELGSCGRALNDAHAFLSSQSSEKGAGNGGNSGGVSFMVADALKEANDRAIRAETHLSEVADDFKKALERASEAATVMESRYEAKVRQCEEEVVDLTSQCTSLREEVNSVRSLNESLHTDLYKDREEKDANQSLLKIELESALRAAEERAFAASAALETQRIEFEEKFSQLLSAAASTEAMRMSERDSLEGMLSSSEGSLLATEAKLRERDVQLEHAREALDIATEQLSALRESSRRQLEVMKGECEREVNEVIKSKDEAIFNASNERALLEDKIKSQSMQHAIALNDLKGQLKAQKESEVELQQRAARAIAASAQVARAAQEEARSIKTSTSLAAEVRHLAASHREHVKSGVKASGVNGSVLISSKPSPQVTAKATTSKVKSPVDPVKPVVADLTSALLPSSVPPPPNPPPQPLATATVPIAAVATKPAPASISTPPPAPVAASVESPIVSLSVSAPVTPAAAAPTAAPVTPKAAVAATPTSTLSSKSITPAVANVPPAPTVDTTAALSKPTSAAAIAKAVEPTAKGTTSLPGTALPTPVNVAADSSTAVAPKKLTWSEMQKLKAQKTTT